MLYILEKMDFYKLFTKTIKKSTQNQFNSSILKNKYKSNIFKKPSSTESEQ